MFGKQGRELIQIKIRTREVVSDGSLGGGPPIKSSQFDSVEWSPCLLQKYTHALKYSIIKPSHYYLVKLV